ncbi:MAG TPA: RNA-binding cell elongation regulator Jag/EloR [Abditibacteriaceae bacterium]|jgi:spoIIIJ-associated protein
MAFNFSPMRMTASTEDAAIAQVLQLVGASRDDVSVEVLSQTDKGVTVRVSPRSEDAAPAAPSTVEIEATPEPSTPVATPIEPDTADADDGAGDDEATEEAIDDATEVVAGQSAPLVEDRVEDEGNSVRADANEGNEETEEPREVAPVREALPPLDEATQSRAVEAAQDFLDRMGLEAKASVGDASKDASARLLIDIDGEDVGILIGKHGQTLQSFQYLLNVTLNNALENGKPEGEREAVRVVVDAGGYRARRMGSLQQSARDAASKVKRDRRPFRMEPMPAHERRLVHMALQDDTTLATSSEGREPMRYVVVAPAGYKMPESGGGRGGNRGGGFGGNRGGRSGGNYGRGR